MELTITFFSNLTLVVYFILALFFILLSCIHLSDEHNRFSISKSFFLLKVLYSKIIFFINPARRICEEQKNYLY